MFLWLVARNRLLTNQERSRRHLTVNSNCQRCNYGEQTELYALQDCPESRRLWLSMVPNHLKPQFFSQNLNDWLNTNLKSRAIHFNNVPWSLIFDLAIWKCWSLLNLMLFSPASTNKPTAQSIYLFAINFRHASECVRKLIPSSGPKRHGNTSWKPPDEGSSS